MDKKRSVLNVTISIMSRIILLFAALIVRRYLIKYIGNNVNGLNSLYSSVIGMLEVVELGIGRSIIFSMYAPIVAGEKEQIAALYGLYKKLYRIIGCGIFTAGLVVMPFLPVLISDYETIDVNVYFTFLITLVSVVLSYFYSAKSSLIEAYKNNYITTGIVTIASLVRYGLQIIVILRWKSYPAFLACQIIGTLLAWALTEVAVRNKHSDIITLHIPIDIETRNEVSKNVKAMVMHKVGTMLVKNVDNMVISGFLGVIVLGKYSNYAYIAGVMTGIIGLFFTPLTSIVGHLCAVGDKEKTKEYFDCFYCINYILGFVFFLGYYAVIDYVVCLLFGMDLQVSRAVVFIITLNSFISYMRSASLLFRNASGTFYYDRWKPVTEGVLNLALSLVFVWIFPLEYKVVGVVVATIITTLLICYIVEPYVIYKHVFGKSPQCFYIRNYVYTLFFGIILGLISFFIRPEENAIVGVLSNGLISVGISAAALSLVALFDNKFRREVILINRKRMGWARKK